MTKQPVPGATASPIPYILSGSASVSTNAGNMQVAANLSGTDPFTPGTSGIKAVTLGFGSTQTGATNARIAFVNDNLFAALENPGSPSTVNGVTVPVNDANSGSNIYLVTQAAAPPSALLPNGLCSCQYLQWGYWGGELDTPAAPGSLARIDVGHVNSWVAGLPTPAADLVDLQKNNVTGTYTGGLFGSVFNNGAQYLASGGLQATYNFATQMGAFHVINYDGLSFAATGKNTLTGSNYKFGVNNVPGLAGSVSGSFYGPMAAETGGNFAFSKTVGSPYFTSAIFAAKRGPGLSLTIKNRRSDWGLYLDHNKNPPERPAGFRTGRWPGKPGRPPHKHASWAAGRPRLRYRGD
jgi:hypothetical protein